MCLENAKLMSFGTAKPIKCYKVLIEKDDGLETPYTYSGVEMGETYKSNVAYDSNARTVDVAIHSFANFTDSITEFNYHKDANMHLINLGLAEVVIALCEIPAGSIVYKGTFTGGLISYASSSIKYKRILRRFKA